MGIIEMPVMSIYRLDLQHNASLQLWWVLPLYDQNTLIEQPTALIKIVSVRTIKSIMLIILP